MIKPYLLLIILIFLIIGIPANLAGPNSGLNQTIKAPNLSGPDYEITKISLPVQTSWIEPGTYISPNISIQNAGADDTITQPIQIQAFLGKYQLISKNNMVSSFKSGEERVISPNYLIPNGVPTGEYTLTVSANRGEEQEGVTTENNKASAPDQVSVKQITSKTKVRSCNCA
jgi:hypothetical protein